MVSMPQFGLLRAKTIDRYITRACNASMPLRTLYHKGRRAMCWWTDHIVNLRSTTLSLRRAYQSSLRRHGQEGSVVAKTNFAGTAYKIVIKKFGDGSTRLAFKGREQAIADHLFSAALVTNWDTMPSPAARNNFDPDADELIFDIVTPEFTLDELIKATKKMTSERRESRKTSELLVNLLNPILEKIDEWMITRGLQLAHHNTEAVILTKKWTYIPPQLGIGGTHIPLSKHLRYLGVILDSRLSFVKHAETLARKASTSATSSFAKARTILRRPQRVAALRTIRAYKMVSDEAAFVLSGMPPIDLINEESARIKARASKDPLPSVPPPTRITKKKEERRATIVVWQKKREGTIKAPWTRRIIPNIARWENRTTPRVP
ncbi:hypothetical protein AGLY_010777 [Aphis glycines]|uniref:Uncharacterized protein n=1 Tax=Aphis glycines TaxID=307491 RepID=A0A6G0TFF0_APHGL|nr:hypothetical protein AGLY_010777 [Aphis glycines]